MPESTACYSSYINVLDVDRSDDEYQGFKTVNIQEIINCIQVLIQMLCIVVFRIYIRKKIQSFQQDEVRIQQYSVLIKKIPSERAINDVIDHIDEIVPGTANSIEKIIPINDLTCL